MSIPEEGLCPKMPQKLAGIRPEPPISDPRPMTDAPEPRRAPYKNKNSHSQFNDNTFTKVIL